jgi:hypothetical protein
MATESTDSKNDSLPSALQTILIIHALFLCWMPLIIYGSLQEGSRFYLYLSGLLLCAFGACLWFFPEHKFGIETAAWCANYAIDIIIGMISTSGEND